MNIPGSSGGANVTSRIPEGRDGKAGLQALVRKKDKGSPTLIPYASKSLSRSCKGKERSQLLPLSSPGSFSWRWLMAKGTQIGSPQPSQPPTEREALPTFTWNLILIYLPSSPLPSPVGQVLPWNKRDQLINSVIISRRNKKRKGNNPTSGPSSATGPLRNPG